ncbi:MAG TPA: hypothetical protein VJN96_15205 [Vicinamibacterales bacterium]|nr:hypothetical protein [Vicinamibacterales bacterium]
MRRAIAECVVFGLRPLGWLVNRAGLACHALEWLLFRLCWLVAKWGGESPDELDGPPPTLAWWLHGE